MNHQPSDNGALFELGLLARTKTTKALCGKRVAFAAAHPSKRVDCPHCHAELARQRDSSLALLDAATLSLVSEHVRGIVAETATRTAAAMSAALER